MIKLILCDLDGTLFDKNKNISDGNIKAIRSLKETKFVVATGRPISGAMSVASTLGLDSPGNYTVCYNGALIVENKTLKPIYKRTIPGSFVKKAFKAGMEFGTNFHAFLADGTLVTNEKNPYTAVEERLNHLDAKVIDVTKIDDNEQFLKCMLVGDKELLDHVMENVPQEFLEETNMVRSAGIYLEFLNKECNKGYSLLFLQEYLNLETSETMAIGDAHNDKYMLEVAGTAVAMKNSFPCLFEVATFVTDDNESSGVAKAIARVITC